VVRGGEISVASVDRAASTDRGDKARHPMNDELDEERVDICGDESQCVEIGGSASSGRLRNSGSGLPLPQSLLAPMSPA
jgi:hypothetical protein